VAPGAIATGMVGAISTLTTRIISTKITSTTSTEAAIEPTSETERERAANGNTIRSIVAMRLMATEEPPASSVDVAPVAPVVRAVSGDLVVQVEQAVLVVLVGRVVQVGLANQAAQAASVVLENQVAQGALGNRVAPVVPVALDQQDVPAAARARSPQHDRAGVAAPIKLATAVYQAGGARVHLAGAAVAIVATLRARAAAVAAPA
jgi:hypothetical protein